MKALDRTRVVIRNVRPQIDGGRYPIKRTLGEVVSVEAEIFTNGHNIASAVLRYRHQDEEPWVEMPMMEIGNDRWKSSFRVTRLGLYLYTLEAWINPFLTWYRNVQRRFTTGVFLDDDLLSTFRLLKQATYSVSLKERPRINELLVLLKDSGTDILTLLDSPGLLDEINDVLILNRDPKAVTRLETEFRVVVDPTLARFGAWYEMFPRSCSPEPDSHGTLTDLANRLPLLADLGFDVLYIPPIHPIGQTGRKGRNNSPLAQPDDPGSPWAVGSKEGGHKAIHRELGTLDDFAQLLLRAQKVGIQIAIDIALQCSPDHPYLDQHPEWFRRREDGSIQFAEDPPYRYEDIYPFDFDCQDWPSLWLELKSIFGFWIAQGVTLFRVDNPHTKPFDFWKWLIDDLKSKHPSLIFLAEGLTRPSLMIHLARVGFSQSYDYFPWRNTKGEITDYYTFLTQSEVREFFRPNLWINTPQLLPAALQQGRRPAFKSRLILAATLGASYGIYGPAYEECQVAALAPGSTEYADSEQYELKAWQWELRGDIQDLLRHLNRARHQNEALQSNERLFFHRVSNDNLVAFSKTSEDGTNRILTVVNLDPQNVQTGWIDLMLDKLNLPRDCSFTALDVLTGERYVWHGSKNYVALDPSAIPGHVLRLERT